MPEFAEPVAVAVQPKGFKPGALHVTSNRESADELRENLVEAEEKKPVDPAKNADEVAADKVSEAASALGKKGAEAAAEKREADKKAADLAKAVEKGVEKAEAKKGNPKHDPNARVREAVQEAKEAKEALARERQERAAFEARIRALETGPRDTPKEAKGNGKAFPEMPIDPRDPKPQLKDFENVADHTDALVAWHGRRAELQRRVETEAHAYATKVADAVGGFVGARKAIEDPDEAERINQALEYYTPGPQVLSFLTGSPADPSAPYTARHVVADLLLSAGKQGPSLALYLMDHPDEREALERLPSTEIIEHELGKIVSRLSDATTDTSRRAETVSKASPPLKSVKGTPPPAAPDKDSDNESFAALALRRGLSPRRRRSA